MRENNLEILVDDLSAEWRAARPLRHPFVRVLPWIALALSYVTGAAFFIGLRLGLPEKLGEAPFLFEIGLTLAISVSAAFATGWMAIPDMRGQKWILAVPISLFMVFLFYVGCRVWIDGVHIPAVIMWNHCINDALLMGLVPVLALVFLSRRGATTKPGGMAFMSILAVGALGWAGLRFTCDVDDVGHTFLYHFLPFAVIGALLGMLARKVYRW